MTARALEGVRVLDLTRYLPGYYMTFLLRSLGAEVVRVERPPDGDPGRRIEQADGNVANPGFDLLNAGNRSVTLDFADASDRAALDELVRGSDVLVHSFLPRVAARWGIDAGACARLNEALVHCTLVGYSLEGTRVDEPGHDINYLAEAGYFDVAAGPPRLPPIGIADLGGATAGALAIAAALLERERTGAGTRIEVSMTDAIRSWLQEQALQVRAEPSLRGAGVMRGTDPLYGVYETRDGAQVALGAVEARFRAALLELLGLAAPVTSERVAAAVGRWDAEPLDRELRALGACANVAATLDEALPERGLPVLPFRMAGAEPARGASPAVGQHNAELLERA